MLVTAHWVGLLYLFSQAWGLTIKTACVTTGTSINPSCADTEMILPWKLYVDESPKCQSGQDDPSPTAACCLKESSDSLSEYCLPSTLSTIKQGQLQDLVNSCTGQQTCQLNGTLELQDGFAALEYECISNSSVVRIKENSKMTGRRVFLYSDKSLSPNGINCVAYPLNCEATVTVRVVASHVPTKYCVIHFNDDNPHSYKYMSCANFDTKKQCRPSHGSALNYLDMIINVIKKESEDAYVLLEIEASDNETATVACGEAIPSDVPRGCPTTTPTTSTSTLSTTRTIATATASANANGNTVISKQAVSIKTSDEPGSQRESTTLRSQSTSSSISNASATVTTTPLGSDNLKNKIGKIAGIGAGCVVVVVLISVIFIIQGRKNRGTGSSEETNKDDLKRSPCYTDPGSIVCENPIYATDDFKVNVRDSKVKDEEGSVKDVNDEVKVAENNNLENVSSKDEVERPTFSSDKPFGSDLRIKKNAWSNPCPDYIAEMHATDSLARLDEFLNAEVGAEDSVEMADLYAKVISKDKRRSRTRSQVSELYAKVVPWADKDD